MSVLFNTGGPQAPARALRVGLFGILGAGNLGNDAQMEAVLRYLRAEHPEVEVDALCTGPEHVFAEYQIPATGIHRRREKGHQWQGRARQGSAPRKRPSLLGVVEKSLSVPAGACATTWRIVSWVRRRDVVIVPGAGILETSMPLRPWELPYALLVLCASGKLFRTKVALVSVGGSVISQRLTRWLCTSAAKLAFYRSYRDTLSRDAMRQQGVDTARDPVYPDLTFHLPVPSRLPGDPQIVGVGVMAYYGTNDERKQAGSLHDSYVAALKEFLRWVVDSGRKVRLFVGDTNGADDSVARELLSDLRAHRPDLGPEWFRAEQVSTFGELMEAMAPVGAVVATRYHNVVCALKLAKPVISISYSGKHDVVMEEAGLGGFCESARSLDAGRLIKLFLELQEQPARLRRTLMERHDLNAALCSQQFRQLSGMLFAADRPGRQPTLRSPASSFARQP